MKLIVLVTIFFIIIDSPSFSAAGNMEDCPSPSCCWARAGASNCTITERRCTLTDEHYCAETGDICLAHISVFVDLCQYNLPKNGSETYCYEIEPIERCADNHPELQEEIDRQIIQCESICP